MESAQTATDETIRKIVEEGLEARNLLNFIADGTIDDLKVSKKPPTSPRPQSVSPKPPTFELNKGINARLLPRSNKRRTTLSRPKSRLRSASAGRNPEKDLRARYWTFLFENLHRAVDEIYQTCEMDESIVESKEAIMMLENYSKDFHALIQYININKDYEKTAPFNRPTSLAWEVRKSSPGKSLLKNVFIEKLTAGSTAKRLLCFDSPNELVTTTKVESVSEDQCDNKEDNSRNVIEIKKSTVEELKPLDLSNDAGKQCNIKISVIPVLPDPNFPCNDSLVVNEIACHEAKMSLEIQNETENVNSLCDSKVEDCSASLSANMINASADDTPSDVSSHESVSTKSIPNIEPPSQGIVKKENINNKNSKVQATVKKSISEVETKTLLRRSKSSISDAVSTNKVSSGKKSEITGSRKTSLTNSIKNKVPTNSDEKSVIHDKISQTAASKKVSSSSSDGKTFIKQESTLNNGYLNKESSGNSSLSKESSSSVPSKPHQVKISISKVTSNSSRPTTSNGNKTTVKSNAIGIVVKPEVSKFVNVKKSISKSDATTEKQKHSKPLSTESAIKRNISYVSSLSSKNQQERSIKEARKPPRPMSGNLKLSQKSGSMTSINKSLVSQVSTRKTLSVEKIPEALKSNADDDSDGWEMVRGRNRSRNSPAKKIPFMGINQENQAIQIAKLNQSRIGGFPYTNKSNLKNPVKSTDAFKKNCKQEINNEESSNIDLKPINSLSNKDSDLASSKKISVQEDKTKSLDMKENVMDNFLSNKVWLNKISKQILKLDKNEGKLFAKFNCDHFLSNRLSKSASVPDIHSKLETRDYKLTKALSGSVQSLRNQKYISINALKKKLLGKEINAAKKKIKKTKIVNGTTKEMNSPNGSHDESDNGVTSDDQDGMMSRDEYDFQCQELYDTAWKYKILEQQVRKLELSWGEQMDLFDMELRTPGRALEMHEKLSSPFRKKSLYESIRLCNEKQLKAQEQRERLLEEKAQKFKIIEKKRLEMKALIEERQEKQRVIMEQKLQRAEEKRKEQLQLIIKKAHDEKEKVCEIAFINTMGAQHKKHDLFLKEKDHETRLHDIQEERQRRQEEKAAKEAAAEERRKILEAERLARLNEMQAKRKMRDHKVEQLFLVKEKERQELANQKARDRELRLSALNAQQQISIEELQKKIQLKQEESARRHEENMEQIRQKAFELSVRRCSSNNDDVPQPVPYETKKICTICNVLIGSEVYLLSHLHGKKHQEAVKVQYQGQNPSSEELELYNLKHIVDASTDQLDPNIALDKERQKALKKRCKKLRQRMSNKGKEYESQLTKIAESVNSNVKTKMDKIMNDIKKLSSLKEKNSSDSNLFSSLERCLNDIDSLLKKQLSNDKAMFQAAGGINALVDIFGIISMHQAGNNAFLSKKAINHVSNTIESLIDKSHDICKFMLFSNKVGNLLDFLIYRLNHLIPDNISHMIANNMTKSGELNVKVDFAAFKLIHLLTIILINLSVEYSCTKNEENKDKMSDFQIRLQDMISYIVSIGIVDKLSQLFNSIQMPINNEEVTAAFLLDCIQFLTTLIKLTGDCLNSSSNNKMEDSTQLVATFRVTNMVGVVSFLYGLLLHNGSSSREEVPPTRLSRLIELQAHAAIQMFNNMAVMNLQAFQSILGSEGISLQLRHIISHLLWYCSHLTAEDLLHEIILLVGYFTVLNPENQSIIQAGQRPTVLQQLCCLPFLYFSDPELTDILFPTLITCCYNNSANKTILQQEMTSELLSNYIEVKYLNLEDSNNISNKGKNCFSDISFKKYWSFPVRFPKCHWSSAKQYFSVK